jgi:tripartite-type tricarboxylate transporter receptor subunit TctC
MRTFACIGSLVVALAFFAPAAHAQPYPSKPITIVVGFTAGGTTDVITRLLGERLNKTWGQPIIIDNKPGAGGNIAAEIVAKARPDGYTLLMSSGGPLAVNTSLYKSLPYDSQRDFTPVTQVVDVPNMLVVTPSVQAKTVQEFVALVKANPNKYFFATTGNGTQSHLTAEMFKQRAGIDLTHVPYRGAVALNDLLSGESVHCMFATTPSVIQFVRSGKLRALAVTGLKRTASAPDLPTIAESGYPDFDSSSWFGLVGPAGMPRDIVAKLQGEIARTLTDPVLREKLVQLGADPVGSTAEEFGEFIRAETLRWGKVVKAARMSVD